MIITSCFDVNLQLSVENCQNLFIVNCQLYFIIHNKMLQQILEVLSSEAVVKAFDNLMYIVIGVIFLIAKLKSKKEATEKIPAEKRKGICIRVKRHILPR